MTRPLFRALGGTASTLVLLSSMAVPVWAETVNYPAQFPPKFLQKIPDGNGGTLDNSVAPTGSETGESDSLSGNIVTVTDGTGVDYVFGAVTLDLHDRVSNNKVFIESGVTLNGLVAGGVGFWTTNNEVTVTDATRVDEVTGGWANFINASATVSDNTVTIKGTRAVGLSFGGYAKSGSDDAQARGNKVTISDSIVVSSVGGYAESYPSSATASGNSLAISDEALVLFATGGHAYSINSDATASNNTVTISDEAVVGLATGGYAAVEVDATATASNNTVTISDEAKVLGDVIGGYADAHLVTDEDGDPTISGGDGNAMATGNRVTIRGAEDDGVDIGGEVIGGKAETVLGTATATGNSVTINDLSVVGGSVYGGKTDVIVVYGVDDGNGGTTDVGGNGNATATGNSVTISGDNIETGDVYGGSAIVEGNGVATASDNSVVISGEAQTNSVYGGNAEVYGNGDATASNNKITISGLSVVAGNVSGGEAYSGAGNASASGNTVTINDGTVTGNVYGGDAWSGSDSATATNNTVTIISGAPGLSNSNLDLSNSNLYGGETYGAGDAFTGNTLNVLNYSGDSIVVQSVQNFENYNFIFPATQTDPVLEVVGTATLDDDDGRSSTVTASTFGGTAPLEKGVSVALIDTGDLITDDFTQTQAQGQHSATLNYLWTLDYDAYTLTATLDSVQANPQTKVLSQGFLAGMALVNQGADLVAGKGMRDAMLSSSLETGQGLGVFGSLSGGWSRYDTGSNVDMLSISLMTGVSKGVDLIPGRLTLGAFLEYGYGSYDTFNAFSGIDFDGDGIARHFGGGIIGRMDFADTGSGHVYTEASFRLGTLNNEYSNASLRDVTGRNAGGYDADSTYYGLHAGLGFIGSLTDTISMDVYGKYFWTRVQGDDVTLTTGDPISFKDMDSHRVRVGTRFTYAEDKTYTHYAGLAYEHEFDGEAKATTFGYAINTPDIGGGTGIGEIGIHINPTDNPALFLDLGLQVHLGAREGVTGSVQLRYEF